MTDGTDVTTFLMVGKTVKNFFGSSAHSYVYDKGFIDSIPPDSIPPPMIEKLQKPNIFQLRFGTFRSIMNRCDIIVANVFDDIINIESPQQHVELELHNIDVKFIEEVVASASKKHLLLDPIMPTHIPPSRAHTDTPSQSQIVKHLLFEDEIPLKR